MELESDTAEVGGTLQVSAEEFSRLASSLLDNGVSVAQRHRDLFTLLNIGTNEAIDTLAEGMRTANSALLRHEIAYALGQLQNTHAIPYLNATLKDTQENSMVRHEAGEALGAIGSVESLPLLEEYSKDPVPEVAETCLLAIDTIKYRLKHPNSDKQELLFDSVDPAPPYAKTDVPKLREVLLDTSKSMFKRYRALFALREHNTKEAVEALCAGFEDDSALLRHEIAYVLGQMRNEFSVDCLTKVLNTNNEHAMVRHEAAEALGAIATDQVTPLLRQYCNDHEEVVRESCYVALDVSEYMVSGDLHYANSVVVQRTDNSS